jgi:hypothetical protein
MSTCGRGPPPQRLHNPDALFELHPVLVLAAVAAAHYPCVSEGVLALIQPGEATHGAEHLVPLLGSQDPAVRAVVSRPLEGRGDVLALTG